MFYGSAFILKGYIMKITAVIVAGGKGTRMGADKNKVFLIIFYTLVSAYSGLYPQIRAIFTLYQ